MNSANKHPQHETAARILACAEDLFGRRGFDAVAVADIAETCNVSTGLIYYHFKDKQSLLTALIEQTGELIRKGAHVALNAPGTAREQLESFVAAYVRLILERENLMRLLIRTITDDTTGAQTSLLERTANTIGALAITITRGIESGEFANVDPALAAECLFGMMNVRITARALHAPINGPASEDPDEVAAFIIRLFLEGISA